MPGVKKEVNPPLHAWQKRTQHRNIRPVHMHTDLGKKKIVRRVQTVRATLFEIQNANFHFPPCRTTPLYAVQQYNYRDERV